MSFKSSNDFQKGSSSQIDFFSNLTPQASKNIYIFIQWPQDLWRKFTDVLICIIFSDTLYNIDHQYEQKGAIHLRRNTDLSKILEVSYQSSYQPHGRMCYQSKLKRIF